MATTIPSDPGTESQQHSSPRRSNRFFDWMRGLGIPRQPGWIGGVCAGIGARLGIDPIIVRGIVVVIAIFGGPALLLYAAAWLLLPDRQDEIHLEQLGRGKMASAIGGIGVLVLLALLPVGAPFFFGVAPWIGYGGLGDFVVRAFWTLFVIALVVIFIVWVTRHARRIESWSPASSSYSSPGEQARSEVISEPVSTPTSAPTPPPVAPPADADAEELAAWRQQQALWKREHDAWKQQQAESERALVKAQADRQRRLHQEQQARLQRERRERRRRTRSHPLFTLIAIGAALVSGAAVMLGTGDGHWTSTGAITGMAVMLGVLGLGIVVNGFLGHRSGGSSGLAVLVTFALVGTSLLSGVGGLLGPKQTITWSPVWAPDHSEQRVIMNGDVILDLHDFYAHAPDSVGAQYSNGIRLIVATGTVRVILPSGEYSGIQAQSATGTIKVLMSPATTAYGPFANEYRSFTPPGIANQDWSLAKRTYYVTIMVGSGDITIEQQAASKGPTS